jgi:hypothetical protein
MSNTLRPISSIPIHRTRTSFVLREVIHRNTAEAEGSSIDDDAVVLVSGHVWPQRRRAAGGQEGDMERG